MGAPVPEAAYMVEPLSTEDQVDTHDAAGMVAWLRNRAEVNRNYAALPPQQWEANVLPHIAFRLDQAADMIERLDRKCGAMALLLYGKPPSEKCAHGIPRRFCTAAHDDVAGSSVP
jgi:hypothetical protein